jgi:serine protease AprX
MKSASKTFPASSTVTDPVTGITYTDYYDIFTVGAGYLDIAAALASSDLADAPAASPTAVYDPTTQTVSLVTGTSVVWGNSGNWATSVVWGTTVFVNGTSVVWGNSVCWGDSTSDGFSVVWGTGVVWGDGTSLVESTALNTMKQGE